MHNSQNWWRRFSFLVLASSLVAGGLYAYDNFRPAKGFVSPVVFSGRENNPSFSPFANLGGGKPGGLAAYVSDLGKILGITTTSNSGVGRETSPSTPTFGLSVPTTTVNLTPGSPGVSSNTSTTNNNSSTSPTNSTSNSSSNNSLSSSSTSGNSNTNYTPAQQAVEDTSSVVINYLKSGSYNALYNLMSRDFKDTFSETDFISSFAGSLTVVGGSVSGPPQINETNSEWAEQGITLNLVGGTIQKYLNVYHLENGAWTLFGTQDQ